MNISRFSRGLQKEAMLELYHHGSSVCAAKVRIVLAEKGVEWTGHYLDILEGDQFEPAYLKLNPKAVVPTLVHDGKVITESTVICEYLDEVFPEPPLVPTEPFRRAKMRTWTKAVDEEVHRACGPMTFMASHRHTLMRLGPERLEEFLQGTPPDSVTSDWKTRKRDYVEQGFAAPDAARMVHLYDRYLAKMEAELASSPWLAGDAYSLADAGMTPYLARLDMLQMQTMWTKGRPKLSRWFERIQARPSYTEAVDRWIPDQLRNDLSMFGARSWPEVQRILACA